MAMFSFTPRGLDSGYDDDESELYSACRKGRLEDVEAALANETDTINAYCDGQTPIHAAVLNDRGDALKMLEYLFELGADLDAQTIVEEDTALHLLVLHGQFPRDIDTVVFFLRNKADLGRRNKKLRTPYDCAVATVQYELAGVLDGTVSPGKAKEMYMNKMGQRYGPFIIEAVLESDDRKLRNSIKAGGNPNVLNKYGAGAIHYAVTHTRLPVADTLSLLLDAGVDPNLRDEENDTALNLVIKSDSLRASGQMVRCVQLLVDAGATADNRDLDGKDAVDLAEERGYDDVLAIIRKQPQKKKTQEKKKKTPRVVKQDVNLKVDLPRDDVNEPNEDGLYPIHVATVIDNETRRHQQINSLIDRGAHISVSTVHSGETALHLCAERDYGDTAGLLLDEHIDYTIKNNEGKTAYDVAQAKSHQSVMDAIEKKQREVQGNWQKAGKKAKFCTIL